ncbi:magnesium chelatase domain-containing protein [Pseudomonas lijiangensis]|uniref:magnesium chelatase domain-containing protein n=1 Tax=Pseudomonas lijiangensis TaxID=2995658 RepID=UPI0034D5FE92
MPEGAVKENKDRARSATLNSGLAADHAQSSSGGLPKDDGRFDLAIELGLLRASGQLALLDVECMDELAYQGRFSWFRGCCLRSWRPRRKAILRQSAHW